MSETSSEQQLRESLQPMFRDELMRTWHEGAQAGLKMAHKMAAGVREEVARRIDTGNEQEQAVFAAQAVVLDGLLAGLLTAVNETASQQTGT